MKKTYSFNKCISIKRQIESSQILKFKRFQKITMALVFVFSFFAGCESDKNVSYSFFVAGHVYGAPRGKAIGVYDTLKNKFSMINSDSNIKFGIFTGDIVRSANKKSWDLIDKDLDLLKAPVHFSRGNHDGNLTTFESRYGKSYRFFEIKGDIHFILDSNIGGWNITRAQLSFFRETLNEKIGSVNNIFIYVHHVIWWTKTSKIRPNSRAGMADELTFWKDMAPILFDTNKPVFVFSGDVGAGKTNPYYSYEKHDNLTLITSGMGGGLRDNIIITEVLNDQSVKFRLIALNGEDINALGALEK